MKAAIALVVIALLITTGAAAIDASVQEGANAVAVDNESFTPSTASYVALNESNRDATRYSEKPQLVVRDENGTRVDRTDYDWNATDGTIRATTGGELDGDSTATISYAFYPVPEVADDFGGAWGSILNASTALLMVFVVALVVMSMRRLINR